eukprot:9474106-Pyramimonas_sp.AAC.1
MEVCVGSGRVGWKSASDRIGGAKMRHCAMQAPGRIGSPKIGIESNRARRSQYCRHAVTRNHKERGHSFP